MKDRFFKTSFLRRWLLLLFPLMGFAAGCASDDDPADVETPAVPEVTLASSLSGSGDNGYNDLILTGALRFNEEHTVNMSLLHPDDLDDAGILLDEWLTSTRNQAQALLVLASDDYKELVAGKDLQLAANQRILVFECGEDNLPAGVSSFHIRRYGASYLAGCMAHESPKAYVVAAMKGNDLLDSAAQGFCEGYQAASGQAATVCYLAQDYTGYASPNEAYRLAKDFEDECFIYPLAGGSNSGFYKYTREDVFTLQLVAGMDVDCSVYSTRVPFSVAVHIDQVLYQNLSQWMETGELPAHADYGLGSEGIDLTLNTDFYNHLMAYTDYYVQEDYWQNEYLNYLSIAKEKEAAYVEE